MRQSNRMKKLPSYTLHLKFEAPIQNKLKRQSQNQLMKPLQQKHMHASAAPNKPPERLPDEEAETPVIILHIPGIQAKQLHTDEEERSLTLRVLSLPAHVLPGQGLTQMGQQKKQQPTENVEFSFSSLTVALSESVATGQQSVNYS